jgi:DNA-binding NtrC family response regulator
MHASVSGADIHLTGTSPIAGWQGRFAGYEPQQQSVLSQHAALRILVVEDSDTVRAVWHEMFARIGGLCAAGDFRSAATAMAAILRDPPDIILLDIQLQEGSGMEVLQLVAEKYPSTKVIVVTNYADPI